MLEPGDTVRKKYKLKPFDKGYYPNWTDQTYQIEAVTKLQKQPVYKISENDGRFYPEEVQKISVNQYRVENILKRRKIKGKLQYFVKWLNYPDSFNSWIPAKNLTKL